MMEKMSALAIVPKAKHIGAQRLTKEEYRELMRRRSVVEVVSTLQSHPYFEKTLGNMAQTSLHRQQLENALSKDVFYKYEALMRYSFKRGHFGGFFLTRCEINEILQKLRLMSIGYPSEYIVQMPGFLLTKTCFNLLELASIETIDEMYKLLSHTPYLSLLQSVLIKDGKQSEKIDYLACEKAFETYYYTSTLGLIKHDLSGKSQRETAYLFLCQAEIYNLDLIFRVKAFYSSQINPMQLKKLLIPVYYKLSKRQLDMLADSVDLSAFLTAYNGGRGGAVYGERTANMQQEIGVQSKRVLYQMANRILHFSSTPHTVLTAVLCLADMERKNLVTVIEGVRYGLAPDKIEQFLLFS